MTDQELKAIRERWQAATPGPWGRWPGGVTLPLCRYVIIETDQPNAHADRAFIAHAITDVPALLDEVDRLRTAMRKQADESWRRILGLMDTVANLRLEIEDLSDD